MSGRPSSLLFLLGLGCTGLDSMDDSVDGAPPEESTPGTEDTSDPTEPAVDTGAESSAESEDTGDPQPEEEDLPSTLDLCFEEISSEGSAGPDYDQFSPEIGTHCSGTNHQDIDGIERVVFLGDSVTVGTPPTEADDWYRNALADSLASEFGLESPDWFWQNVNIFGGTTLVMESGDFASCAEWGARTDDLLRDNSQIEDCFPADQRDKRTLVIMTIGGNDLNNLMQGFIEGESTEDLWAQTEESMSLMRTAVEWFTPERFPAGVSVIFTNLYEYTDATGEADSCPAAALAGYETVSDPALEEMVIWSMEEFMDIAVDNSADMLFLLESFCGHGYRRDDPSSRCYRGADAELWFDDTCIHPNATGHAQISQMFMDVVRE